ncbi:sporulation protein YqfD [Pradoshia sp. D12]|uniref:sporulation protein YqfD n=1 Tax=Bacillaceae TaxID=186817 RepID=UPI00080AF616|nr:MULTISPECIES: sporulation protein YqfD [Bacillaceae]OCA86441.1 sporulation protein YqfD [Bacillus sp. FJAT-27986]QFK72240.1 sporulation protein YqfD [Pradoshia sp. D12]TPF71267.1 sporulation protein YqfD [Bacillus sp. D12]
MKNQWTNTITGYIKVKIKGQGTERFINRMLKEGIQVWDAKNMGTETVVFYMKLSDVPQLRKAVRNSGCKVSFLERRGGPFFALKLKRYSGLVVGVMMFFMIIFILSNMIWGIKIEGASPAIEHQISKELDDMNIKVGKLQFAVGDMEDIQKELSERVPSITWIGVQLEGTTFHFQVVEKKQPKKNSADLYVNLISAKKATIVQTMVERGQGLVEKHQVVSKGQILVSGFIGKEDNQKFVGAKGKVMGEAWYKTSVEVPLETNLYVFNGDAKNKYSLSFGNAHVPIWGFGEHNFKEYEVEEDEKTFKFLKWEVPIAFHKKIYRSKEKVTRIYTKIEAEKQAMNMGKKDVLKNAPDDATILNEKILKNQLDNGKVKMTIHYKVLENIAIGQPMIQGD